MENNQKEGASKNLSIKIIVPILILAAVGGIWFFKNIDKSPETTNNNSDFASSKTTNANSDFALNVFRILDPGCRSSLH